jgi:alginate O-acetyltransferase complex protein AlgI
MSFNSFLFIGFIVVAIFCYWFFSIKFNKIFFIAAANIIYILLGNPFHLVIILLSIIFNFIISKKINLSKENKRKYILLLSIFSNIGLLLLFKYFDMILKGGNLFLKLFGVEVNLGIFKIAIPLGISYWTLQTISYNVDIYWQKLTPERSFWIFFNYITFFPKLTAGPILNSKINLPQFKKKRRFSWQFFNQGLFLIVFGYFMKTVFADNLSPYVSRIYDYGLVVSFKDAWIATYAFSIEIFADFCGYSNIAIGISLILGFSIPENFNYPFAATNFIEFWRRWHISLSDWLRNYLFLPISYAIMRHIKSDKLMNIKTEVWGYNIGIFLTMVICGIWHGASFNFVLWGAFHGVLLIINQKIKYFKKTNLAPIHLVIRRFIVFSFVSLGWVFFRADFSRSCQILKSMFIMNSKYSVDLFTPVNSIVILFITLCFLTFHKIFSKINLIRFANKVGLSGFQYSFLMSIMLAAIIFLRGNGGTFIYFQF